METSKRASSQSRLTEDDRISFFDRAIWVILVACAVVATSIFVYGGYVIFIKSYPHVHPYQPVQSSGPKS
jgi:hypothetical protein